MTHPESLPQLLFTPMKLVGPETLAAWNPQWRGHVLRMDRRKVKLPAIILGCTAFNLAGRRAFLDLSYFICIYIILYIYIGCIGERDFDCCITIGCSIASIDSSRLFKLTNLKVHNQLYMCLILILSSNSFLNTIFCLQIECCEGIAVNYAVTKCSVSLHENPSGHLDGRIDCCQERQGGNCHSGDVWLITIWSWNRMKTSTFVSSIPDSRLQGYNFTMQMWFQYFEPGIVVVIPFRKPFVQTSVFWYPFDIRQQGHHGRHLADHLMIPGLLYVCVYIYIIYVYAHRDATRWGNSQKMV